MTTAQNTDPQPPQDREAEAGLLGCILIYPDALDEVVEILRGEEKDFYIHEHRAVYAAMLALYRAAEPIDLVILVDKLRQMGKLDEAGGVAFVSALANNAPPPGRIGMYARIVRTMATRRGDIALADYIAREAYSCENEEAYAIVRQSVGDALSDGGDDAIEEMPILTDEEAEALPPLKGILGDILFEDSVSYLYGPSGRWKSFVALDWSLSIATGRAWMGRPVIEGDVLYVCSEGARGIGKRITAWKRKHSVVGQTRLRVMPLAIDLTNAAQVAALPRRLDALDIQPALIVFDTLAASNSGDENTAENAARITAAARRIIRAHPDVCVLIVHHTGYDNTHMRGSTAFYSNADTVVRIEGGDANRRIEPGEPITIISDKPKEGEPFHDIVLTAERQTWADEAGNIYASLVMVAGEEAAAESRANKTLERSMTPKRRAALDLLEDAPDEGLAASVWWRASGMGESTFYKFTSFAREHGLIELTPAGNYRLLATPLTPLHSTLNSGGSGKFTPLHSGVSIDTGSGVELPGGKLPGFETGEK